MLCGVCLLVHIRIPILKCCYCDARRHLVRVLAATEVKASSGTEAFVRAEQMREGVYFVGPSGGLKADRDDSSVILVSAPAISED